MEIIFRICRSALSVSPMLDTFSTTCGCGISGTMFHACSIDAGALVAIPQVLVKPTAAASSNTDEAAPSASANRVNVPVIPFSGMLRSTTSGVSPSSSAVASIACSRSDDSKL
jgi:hypothetical protein